MTDQYTYRPRRDPVGEVLAWTDDSPMPPSTATVDEVLAWCGKDVGRLHEAYAAELARDPRARRPVLLSQLRDRLGWPLPDTPPGEVLTYAGRPSWPLSRVLATEVARPERYQRAELIAELRRRVAAAGANASSVAPVETAPTPGGLFR